MVRTRMKALGQRLACLGLLFWIAQGALAQSVPFLIRVQQAESVSIVAVGGGLTVNGPIGRAEILTVVLTYQGQGVATINGAPEVLGGSSFTVLSSPATPQVLTPGASYRFTIQYLPRSSRAVLSQISVPFVESIPFGSGSNAGTQTNPGLIFFQLQGTAPELVIGYLFPDTLTYIPLTSGGTIPFPVTQVNETSQVLLSIANRGSGSGELRSVSVTGEGFSIAGLGLLPGSVQPGSEARFTLRAQPRSAGDLTGRLNVVTELGEQNAVLTVQAFSPVYEYEIIQRGGIASLAPGQTINLGEALPTELLSAQILIRNVNPVTLPAPAISLFGTGFALQDPPAAGRALRSGETISFFVQALIGQIGPQRGRLRIGNDAFELLATGSGNQLRFSYRLGDSGNVTVAPGTSIFFTPTQFGLARSATVTVRNSGTSEANIINISLLEPRTSFSLSALPALPLRLAAGEEFSFAVEFRPAVTGSNTATLRIDGANFTLTGTSTAAPALPAYTFTLPSGDVNPLEQPAVGLELASPYPAPLSGVLVLSQEASGAFGDPSVRFANGTQSATFTIPANTTRAVFANGSNSIRFQTGSVAGLILISANFTLGGASSALEDLNPSVLRLNVRPAAPRILSLQVQPGSNALGITLTGLAVSRSLTRMDIQLTPVQGFDIPVTSFSVSLQGESLAWFRNAASQSAGGVFSLQLPLNFSLGGNSSAPGVSNLIQSISAVQVTLTNEFGTSSPVSITLR
jgi:hypothetical protein